METFYNLGHEKLRGWEDANVVAQMSLKQDFYQINSLKKVFQKIKFIVKIKIEIAVLNFHF